MSNVCLCDVEKVSIEFEENKADELSLVDMRVWVPAPEEKDDGLEHDVNEYALELNQAIIKHADIGVQSNKAIAEFDKMTFQVPRGKYEVQFYEEFFRIMGATYKYKVPYSSVTRMFWFEEPDEVHEVFIIELHPPIRAGQKSYQHLVVQVPKKEPALVYPQLPPERIEEDPNLETEMSGPLLSILMRIFKSMSKKKIMTTTEKFKARSTYACVATNYKANSGHLYVLAKSFFFIRKPPVYIRNQQIASVEFSRLGTSAGKTFDLHFHRTDDSKYSFTSIQQDELTALFTYGCKCVVPFSLPPPLSLSFNI